jgi:hypothetical protein
LEGVEALAEYEASKRLIGLIFDNTLVSERVYGLEEATELAI